MDNYQYVNIIGQETPIKIMTDNELKKVYVDAILGFDFYDALYHGERIILLKPKRERQYTPTMLMALAKRIGKILNAPIVFWYESLTTTQRDRLIAKGIYFIIPKKYASLPYLVISRLASDNPSPRKLSPCAQYLLLFHLQKENLNSLDASKIAELCPYGYVTVTKALRDLTTFGLCDMMTLSNRTKTVYFINTGKDLWEKALPLFSSPIKEKIYCDAIDDKFKFVQSGINALSHYSNLNQERMQSFALTRDEFKFVKPYIKGLNDIEGNICLEIWKYPPIPTSPDFVDKLSLYLSMREDKDPRVEKELEIMFNSIW